MAVDGVFRIQSAGEFEVLALETFAHQYHNVAIYKEFCDLLGRKPDQIKTLGEIPFLPIEFFKSHRVMPSELPPEIVFRSSGTTGSVRSQHFVADLGLYRESFTRGFEQFYGKPSKYCIVAVLPSYQERSDASLSYMVEELIGQSAHPNSGFYSVHEAGQVLDFLSGSRTQVLLIGVTFALLDLVKKSLKVAPDTIVMETGGMKGRRKEMVRAELHKILSEGFGLESVHSEYGMTELLSQAYSSGQGLFQCPPWMQVRIRDTEDPLSILESGRTGGVDIIDLANQHSCAFIATQDLGKSYDNGTFEILGRFDHSDIRGCNLMAL